MRADATTCELWLAEKHHAHEYQQCMHMRAAHTHITYQVIVHASMHDHYTARIM
jgi:hypothetical protein